MGCQLSTVLPQGIERKALWQKGRSEPEEKKREVMASLIGSTKVAGKDRLEVTWRYGDVYEKILGEMQGQ